MNVVLRLCGSGPDDRATLEAFLNDFQEKERLLEPDLYLSADQIVPGWIAYLFAECGEKKGRIVFAEDDDTKKALGYICFWDEPVEFMSAPTSLKISDLYVSPEARGLGVGRLLLAEAEAVAAGRGHKLMSLEVLARNEGGRAMYHKCGWREFQVTMVKKIDQPVDM